MLNAGDDHPGQPRRVLVTGGSGFVGRRVVERLRAAGWWVRTLSLDEGAATGDPPGGEHWRGDLLDPELARRATVGVDAVVHLAARVHVQDGSGADLAGVYHRVNAEGTRRLAAAAAANGTRRFLFLSTVKVHGERTPPGGPPMRADDPPAPADAYAESKWAAERGLAEVAERSGLEWVVIRPPLVYGPGVKANFLRLLQWVERGVPLPLGGVRNRRSLVGLTNLADLIERCLTHPAAAGRAFLATDGEDVSTPELLGRLADSLGRRPRLVPVPEGLLRAVAGLAGRRADIERLCGWLQVDSQPARDRLEWVPPCSMAGELAATVDWYRQWAAEGRKR